MAKLINVHSGGVIGEIKPFAGSSVPSYALACNGTAVSRTTYAALFAAIGTTYGAGDGSTTFNLPDTRNVFLRGINASTRTIGGVSYPAVTLGATVNDKMQGHLHGISADGTYIGSNVGTDVQAGGVAEQVAFPTQTDAPISDGTNGTPRVGSETAPVNLGINYIITWK